MCMKLDTDVPWSQLIISDMMKSPVVNRCDFGYVYNGVGDRVRSLMNSAQTQENPRYIFK
jgi:hypothetical protein